MPDLVGRYRLDDRLGEGGMGVVYRAWDTVLERVVALKLMIGDTSVDPAARERFFREARSAAQLTHKNIVTVYDLGEHQGQPYLAMEFLDGEDLQRRLARAEKASVWRKIDIAIEICHGMEFAHAHGVIHRDLKPANIFITASGGVKILDFGLARFISSQLTRSNMLLGTINYMSPEQVRGERAEQQSDVFSIGVVLYELFGGRRAFEGDSAASTLYKILQEFPEPLWKIDSGLPRELTTIIECALAKPRDERYPDVAGLRRDLEVLRHTSPHAGPTTPWPGAVVPSDVAPAPDIPSRRTPSSPPPVHPVTSAPDLTAAPEGAARVAAAPAAREAGNTRGFWIGAGLGGLAVALLVVWMANRRAEPVSAPTPTVPAETRSAPEPAPSVPSAPAASPETLPGAGPARGPASERRPEPRRDAATAAPSAARRPARGEIPIAPTVETPAAPLPPAAVPVQPTVANPSPQPPPASAAPAPQPEPPSPSVVAPQPAAPAPAVEPPPLSRERANELLERYKAALEAKSLDQLKRIWPSLGGAAEAALRQEFQHASRIAVDISEPQVSASGTTARISFVRRYSLLTEDGQRLQSTSQAAMDVHRSGDAWLIDSLRFTPR